MVKNSLTNAKPRLGLTAYLSLDGVKDQINKAVGGQNAPRFMSSIVSAVNVNPALKECTNASILSSALLGEALKLSPSPQLGQYYMVPFNDKEKGKVAQFILGYKGYIQLALRSGQYKKLNVLAIKEGELIHYDPLNEDIDVRLIEDEIERENTPTVGYYAFFEYLNGFRKTMYWSKARMISHADKYSAAFSKNGGRFGRNGQYNRVSFADYEAGNYDKKDEWMYSSFWYKDFDAMAYKTMLRQLISKWGIMSIDLVSAFESDYTIEGDDGSRVFIETDDVTAEMTPETPSEPEPVIVPTEDAGTPQNASDDAEMADLEWE